MTAAAAITVNAFRPAPDHPRAPAAAGIPAACLAPSPAAAPTFTGRELQICAAIAAGDRHALAALYNARFPLVFATARRITSRDEAFCLDVVQETFLRVIASSARLAHLPDAPALDHWLIRLAHTAALDLLKAEQRRTRRERRRAASGHPSAPTSTTTPAEQIEHVRSLLARLDDEDRAAIRLRINGATLDQAGRALGSTGPAAHGRIRRALQRLRTHLQERDHE